MKIGFFHLMPYRFLPDDFEARFGQRRIKGAAVAEFPA